VGPVLCFSLRRALLGISILTIDFSHRWRNVSTGLKACADAPPVQSSWMIATALCLIATLRYLAVPYWAVAQGCGAHGIAVQVLGSGGPELQDKRASSSYLVWEQGRAIRRIRHRNDQGHDNRSSFHISPEDRQAPLRHLQARALAKAGPEPSSSVPHHLI